MHLKIYEHFKPPKKSLFQKSIEAYINKKNLPFEIQLLATTLYKGDINS